MNKEAFLSDLAELLEVDVLELNDGFEIAPIWDSLAIVSTIALIDEHFDISVSGSLLRECETIGSIFDLIESKKGA